VIVRFGCRITWGGRVEVVVAGVL